MLEKRILEEITHSTVGSTIDPQSVSLFKVQGYMSTTYAVTCSSMPTILHVVEKPFPEQVKQKIPEKITAISNFFSDKEDIPTAQVLGYGYLSNGGYYILQKRCEGEPIGKQNMQNDILTRIYTAPDAKLATSNLERLLARIHTEIPSTSFGHLTADASGNLTAPYATWESFIIDGSACWLNELRAAKKYDTTYTTSLAKIEKSIPEILHAYSHVLQWNTPNFIHGDLVNPTNVLIDPATNTISALLDFEWSVAGDPAWEFAFTQEFPSEAYYMATEEDEVSFEERRRVYAFFWLLWGTSVHANNTDLTFRTWLLRECLLAADNLLN